MYNSPESSIVKILYGYKGDIAGAGVLIGKKWILTCRHVIRKLLRDDIFLSFFTDKLETNYKSKVLFLSNETDPDIAILELEDEAPSCASIGHLVIREKFNDLEFRACGFSSGKEGAWVALIGRGRISPNYVQIDVSSNTGYTIEEGFSGTPVFDSNSDEVVGIVISKEGNPSVLSGCFIPINSIINTCTKNSTCLNAFGSIYKRLDPLKTPLGKIASLIVTRIHMLPVSKERRNEIIREIVDERKLNIKPWSLDKDLCFPFSMAMLSLGLSESLPILDFLEGHKMSLENKKFIFDHLISWWVDSESAACVYESSLHKNNKNAVALNANEHSSARMCIDRASGRPPGKWPTYSCLGRYGVNVVEDIVKEMEDLLTHSKRGRSTNNGNSYQIRKDLKDSIEYSKRIGKPTFFVFNYSKHIAELLPSVQDVFPHITLFLLTGDTYPQHDEFGKLDCKCLLNLGLNNERELLKEIDLALQHLDISDADDN